MTSNYPEPLVVPPLRSHQYTFIILHGRGSNATIFSDVLLSTPISLPQGDEDQECTLASVFPNAKFVFPTASKRRAMVYKRSIINQWFDNWTLADSTRPPMTVQERQDREYLPVEGLRETTAYIHELLRREIELVGGNAKNVFLGGLSQGCAASLVSLLLWEGDPLGAAFGMCGWLPFQKQMEDVAREIDTEGDGKVEGEDFNPFEDSNEDADDGDAQTSHDSPPARAIAHLKETLEMPSERPSSSHLPFQDIPLFLGHGVEDEKVPLCFGRDAASCMKAMGMEVTWKEYAGLEHWYSEDMLGDLVSSCRKK